MRIKVALYIVYISNLLNLNIREFKLFYLQKGNEKIQWIKVIYQDRILKNVLYLRNVHLMTHKNDQNSVFLRKVQDAKRNPLGK